MGRRLRWAAVVALAAILLTYKIGAKDIWLDEAASWQTAASSVPALIFDTAHDIHPPLYYLALKGWITLWGDSLTALRSFSGLTGLAALWLMFELGAALGLSDRVLIAAVIWCAVSPHTIFYGQEARMYPLLTALVLAICLSYRRWMDSGGKDRRWLTAYILCTTAALYVHYFAALIIVALVCHSAIWRWRTGTGNEAAWRSWVRANVSVLLAYAPWMPVVVWQLQHGQPHVPVGVADLPSEISRYVREVLFGHLKLPELSSRECAALVAVLATGLIATMLRAWRRHDERAWFLAAIVIVPSTVALGLLPLSGHLELPRYLVYALPIAILAATYGFAAWRVPAPIVVVILAAGAVVPSPYLRVYYSATATDYDARPMVSYLTETIQAADAPRELVYVAPGYVADVLRYWTRDSIRYVRVHKPATFDEIVEVTEAGPERSWLVVDYRSPAIGAIGADPRFVRVNVPSSSSDRIRLYRWMGGP